MEIIKEFLQHYVLVILLFVLIFIIGRKHDPIPRLLAIAARVKWLQSPYRVVMNIVRKLLHGGGSWAFYNSRSNAVILDSIGECKEFLELHFSEGEAGEIWLFRNDLLAFSHCDDFKALYQDTVDTSVYIRHVRILLPREQADALPPTTWQRISCHLQSLTRCSVILYAFLDESRMSDARFRRYASDEAFIFYTRGVKVAEHETICIHRRFAAEKGRKSKGRLSDLRITLIAARSLKAEDPLWKFLPPEDAAWFDVLFENDPKRWVPLVTLATTLGAGESPHVCDD